MCFCFDMKEQVCQFSDSLITFILLYNRLQCLGLRCFRLWLSSFRERAANYGWYGRCLLKWIKCGEGSHFFQEILSKRRQKHLLWSKRYASRYYDTYHINQNSHAHLTSFIIQAPGTCVRDIELRSDVSIVDNFSFFAIWPEPWALPQWMAWHWLPSGKLIWLVFLASRGAHFRRSTLQTCRSSSLLKRVWSLPFTGRSQRMICQSRLHQRNPVRNLRTGSFRLLVRRPNVASSSWSVRRYNNVPVCLCTVLSRSHTRLSLS